jgi:hypothetical protein
MERFKTLFGHQFFFKKNKTMEKEKGCENEMILY